jgi:carbamoylphosphate synthase small subunit
MNGEIQFDGIFLSNGPGDPAQNTTTIQEIKKAIQANKNIF